MKRFTAEAIGTFFLLFAGCGAVVVNDVSGGKITHVGIALTFGLVVMAMIYGVGEISGAHINPAVTLGLWLAKRLPFGDIPFYLISQAIGAFAAAAALRMLFGNVASLGATKPFAGDMQSFVLEVILTAVLMYVVLNVITGSKETGVLAGIAIGGVIALEALFAGPISGASMNPIRSLAPAVVSGDLKGLWVYLTAPFLGSAIGVIAHKASK